MNKAVRVILTMPLGLKVKIRAQAGSEDKSLNQKAVETLAEAFEFELDEEEPPSYRTARELVESLTGQRLKRDEVVHHIDGNRLNNKPSNLCIVSRKEHQMIHNRIGKIKTD